MNPAEILIVMLVWGKIHLGIVAIFVGVLGQDEVDMAKYNYQNDYDYEHCDYNYDYGDDDDDDYEVNDKRNAERWYQQQTC